MAQEDRAGLLVPMHGRDGKLTGFFSLGDKLSEVRYTSRDKNILATLANQIALVHENISLKERCGSISGRDEVLARFEESDIDLLKECAQCGRCYGRVDEVCEDDGQTLAFSSYSRPNDKRSVPFRKFIRERRYGLGLCGYRPANESPRGFKGPGMAAYLETATLSGGLNAKPEAPEN